MTLRSPPSTTRTTTTPIRPRRRPTRPGPAQSQPAENPIRGAPKGQRHPTRPGADETAPGVARRGRVHVERGEEGRALEVGFGACYCEEGVEEVVLHGLWGAFEV